MSQIRPVYYVSDGTGITAETIGQALLTQFNGQEFHTDRLPFVDGSDRAHEVAEEIRKGAEEFGLRPIVINTCVDPELSAIIAESGGLMLDVFAPFIAPLEAELGVKRKPRVGKAHGIVDFDVYHQRINAMNFALSHDDGVSLDFDEADVILVGVSRAGKTPTCVYLALHHGVRAANYPLTDDDLDSHRLPPKLRAHRHKLFGLTIDPMRLAQIREERRPGSRYAKLDTCKREVADAQTMLQMEGIPMLSTTNASIEEISSRVLETLGINQKMY